MSTGTYSEAMAVPQVHVSAMAAIVQELLTGEEDRLREGGWLRERTKSAGLDAHECAALDALRERLRAGGGDLSSVTSAQWG